MGDKATPESLVGYFPVHIGDQYYYINPFRPWMGYQLLGYEPMAGLGQPVVQQLGQMVNMLGIGLSPGLSYGLEMINKVTSSQGVYLTRGEPMPLFPQFRWLQDLIGLKGIWQPTPEQALFSQNLEGKPDWEVRNLEKELARWIGQEENQEAIATKGWRFPRDIIQASKTDKDAKSVVESQIARMARFGLMSVALPIFSRRNEEEIERYISKDDLIRELMVENGVDPDKAYERAEDVGFSPMMFLNKQQRREIYKAHPEWEPWQGLTRVGISPDERIWRSKLRSFTL